MRPVPGHRKPVVSRGEPEPRGAFVMAGITGAAVLVVVITIIMEVLR
jgi:hypothetical protein